jgi:chromosome segregation ATPase
MLKLIDAQSRANHYAAQLSTLKERAEEIENQKRESIDQFNQIKFQLEETESSRNEFASKVELMEEVAYF